MNSHSVKLLKKCNAGTKIALDAIKDVMEGAHDPKLVEDLSSFMERHAELIMESEVLLQREGALADDPSAMARWMTDMTTKMRLTHDDSDRERAKIIIKGCDKGVEMINEFKDKYSDASESSREFANKVITLDNDFRQIMENYL